jgi:ketosteroid isomerase-like protein
MEKLLSITLLATLALAAASTDPTAEKDVMAAMDAYKNAMIHKDPAVLQKLLSEDLTYIHSAGQHETKADVLKGITSGKTIIERIDFTDTTVRFYGKTALVQGRVDLYHSATNIVHMNVLHVWVKGPQGWQLVARQATKLAN